MMPTSDRLNSGTQKNQDALTWQTGISRTRELCEDIKAHLDAIEDIYLADQRMADLESGRSRRYMATDSTIDKIPSDGPTSKMRQAYYIALGIDALIVAVGVTVAIVGTRR